MCLDRESLVDGQDFEEEGESIAVFRSDLGREESFVLVEELEKGSAGVDMLGRVLGVASHPKLDHLQVSISDTRREVTSILRTSAYGLSAWIERSDEGVAAANRAAAESFPTLPHS